MTTETITIRPEQIEDHAAVFTVNERAFESPAEARLVEALRPVARPLISLVAAIEEKIVGHILFSPVTVRNETGERKAIALGPMAVLPEYQNRGIGSKLALAGLEACREIGEHAVFVFGHEKFYPRFGFRPAHPKGLFYRSESFDPHFMVAELSPGALEGMSGWVKYHPEFDKF